MIHPNSIKVEHKKRTKRWFPSSVVRFIFIFPQWDQLKSYKMRIIWVLHTCKSTFVSMTLFTLKIFSLLLGSTSFIRLSPSRDFCYYYEWCNLKRATDTAMVTCSRFVQISVITGEFELQISCIQSKYLNENQLLLS